MNILLGITGGIAAYKAPDLVRRLKERGADVQIVTTASATEFVTETSLQAVSGRPVRSNLWDKEAERAMSHIELARWADVVLIAPATAEVMARIVSGGAPDLLTTLCLATEAPLVVAPAMNHIMWKNPATQANRKVLEERGVHVLGPAVGSQACGETGAGRMLEPDVIAAAVFDIGISKGEGLLAGKKVVITAGPTREPIDPVRYITNRSSGKMGYAMARAAAAQDAEVILVSGPVSLFEPPGVDVRNVVTAQEMYDATHAYVGDADIFHGGLFNDVLALHHDIALGAVVDLTTRPDGYVGAVKGDCAVGLHNQNAIAGLKSDAVAGIQGDVLANLDVLGVAHLLCLSQADGGVHGAADCSLVEAADGESFAQQDALCLA